MKFKYFIDIIRNAWRLNKPTFNNKYRTWYSDFKNIVVQEGGDGSKNGIELSE